MDRDLFLLLLKRFWKDYCIDLKNGIKWEPQQWIRKAETKLCRDLPMSIFPLTCRIHNIFSRLLSMPLTVVNYLLLLQTTYFLFLIAVIQISLFCSLLVLVHNSDFFFFLRVIEVILFYWFLSFREDRIKVFCSVFCFAFPSPPPRDFSKVLTIIWNAKY